MKSSTILIAVIVILYLIGITWLALTDKGIDSSESKPFMNPTTAPDGTEIKGPTGPPPGSTPPGTTAPDTGSTGPTFPPPTSLNQ